MITRRDAIKKITVAIGAASFSPEFICKAGLTVEQRVQDALSVRGIKFDETVFSLFIEEIKDVLDKEKSRVIEDSKELGYSDIQTEEHLVKKEQKVWDSVGEYIEYAKQSYLKDGEFKMYCDKNGVILCEEIQISEKRPELDIELSKNGLKKRLKKRRDL